MFFFFAALFIGLVLSVFLVPKPKIENAKASQLSDFQFPRSNEGAPAPRIYGTVKTKGVNTIGQCKFKAVPIKKRVSTGLFSHKHVITGYKYYSGLDLGICLGPGVVMRRMWYGNHLIFAGCLYQGACIVREYIDLPELLGGADKNGGIQGWVEFYCGNFDQTASAYLQSNLTFPNPDDVMPAYPGISHIVFEDFYWGNSASIDTIAIEVSYFSNSLGLTDYKYVMPNGLDANPVEVLYDLFVNGWGNLGIPNARFNLASWQAAAETIWTENNGVSAEIANPNTGADVAKTILEQINAMIYQNPTTGEIEILLMRRDYVIADLPVLGPSEIAKLSTFTKKLWADTINRVRIQYKNRDNDYQDATASQDDFGNIRFQGHVRSTDVGMPMCYRSDLASQLAARELSNLSVPLYQCDIEMNRVYSYLTPGKVFVLNWPEYGIVNMVMRIRKMGLGTRKSGKVTMSVVQDEFATDAVVTAAPVTPTTDGGNYNPTDIVTAVYLELPAWIDATAALGTRSGFTRYMTFAKKPGGASIDYFAFIDDSTVADGDTEALANGAYADFGSLSTPVGLFDGFATGILGSLTIGSLNFVPTTGSLADLQSDGQGLILIDDEILGYETCTANMDGTYTISNVHRALMDTVIADHSVGAAVYFFDGQEGVWETDVSVSPFTAYVVDRSVTGRSAESTAPHASLTPVGRVSLPAPPDYITLAASRAEDQWITTGSTADFDWLERNRTATEIAIETDATQTPPAGTTYTLELTKQSDGTVLQTVTGIAAPPYTLAVDPALAPCQAIAKVWAVLGAEQSFTPSLFPVLIITPDTLIIDTPVTVDGDTVEFS